MAGRGKPQGCYRLAESGRTKDGPSTLCLDRSPETIPPRRTIHDVCLRTAGASACTGLNPFSLIEPHHRSHHWRCPVVSSCNV